MFDARLLQWYPKLEGQKISASVAWVSRHCKRLNGKVLVQGCTSIAAILVQEGLTAFINILAGNPDNLLVRRDSHLAQLCVSHVLPASVICRAHKRQVFGRPVSWPRLRMAL